MIYTKRKQLEQDFFNRPTLVVAQELIGKYLIRDIKGEERAYQITEVEAYDGPDDLASHARFGRTKRNNIMFAEAGHIYIYLVYGMHYMLNIVIGEKDYPAAVLIRGIAEINGPGRVAQKLRINKKLHEKMMGQESGLWIEDWNIKFRPEQIKKTPRIGVSYAKEWAEKPYRFVLS